MRPESANIVPRVFTPVLAKHPKSFSLIDCVSVGVDRVQRNFKPMRKQVEAWRRNIREFAPLPKAVIYEAFVEGKLEAPKHLARTVHDLYFDPKYEEFRSRTVWSLYNALGGDTKQATWSVPNRGRMRNSAEHVEFALICGREYKLRCIDRVRNHLECLVPVIFHDLFTSPCTHGQYRFSMNKYE
jgi:hypothetical protein